MVVRFIRDFFERIEREKLRRNLSHGGNMLGYYDADVALSDSSGFYESQMSGEFWRRLFGVLSCFCQECEKVLDVGCGAYELMAVRNDENTVGTDVCKAALKRLKKFGFSGQIVQADCLHLPFRDSSFDCVLSNQMIEHLFTEEAVQNSIREMQRLSRRVMVVTPNAAYGRKIHDPTHFFFFTTRSLKQLMPSFEIYATTPFPYTGTLAYYLQYNSPRLRRVPIIGKIITTVCAKIDSSKLLVWLNRTLWPGSALVAVKTSD